ncbi:PAS domain S-box protein [Halorubellus sp. JP-L1]|uniref:ATP-binding protein n=1 Tax=Halorubellus sp. JP-L1 TaxID=2715753 RepID=UPI001409EA48|nr:ATP-binding protein [Halorubellus sp. JP-L1]NHN43231.1 PAS domain S-box protein [Halorubellus sp. JP-L1]
MAADETDDVCILLDLENRRNREEAIRHLPAESEVASSADWNAVEDEVDLWIVDAATLERRAEDVRALKERIEPLFLPVLLVFPEDRVSALDSSIWDVVDDVVTTPISPAVFEANVESALRTRRLSREALRSQQRFESLVRTTSSAIFFLSPDGDVKYANDAAESLFGYDRDELVGEEITQLIPPEHQDAAAAGIEGYGRRIAPDVGGGVLESTAQRKDGDEIPIQLCYGWFEVDGRTYLTGVVTEISEIRKRETRLQVLNRVLRHDVRNDMNLILGHAETLADELDEPSPHLETIQSVAEDVVRLSDQARELDELVRKEEDATREVDVCTLVEAKCRQYSEGCPVATVASEFPDGTAFTAEAIDLIESALDNLIENAIEHNDDPEPTVTVTVRLEDATDEEWVAVEVADDGPGLPPGDVAVVETNTVSALEHANGLGLWLVSWIVRASNGRIDFEEREPRGSRITVRLPLARTAATTGG